MPPSPKPPTPSCAENRRFPKKLLAPAHQVGYYQLRSFGKAEIAPAGVAELADAYGSGPYGGNPMEVQVLSPAPFETNALSGGRFSFSVQSLLTGNDATRGHRQVRTRTKTASCRGPSAAFLQQCRNLTMQQHRGASPRLQIAFSPVTSDIHRPPLKPIADNGESRIAAGTTNHDALSCTEGIS